MTRLRVLLSRVRGLFRSRHLDQDLRDEIGCARPTTSSRSGRSRYRGAAVAINGEKLSVIGIAPRQYGVRRAVLGHTR